jgi:hypothetical protein
VRHQQWSPRARSLNHFQGAAGALVRVLITFPARNAPPVLVRRTLRKSTRIALLDLRVREPSELAVVNLGQLGQRLHRDPDADTDRFRGGARPSKRAREDPVGGYRRDASRDGVRLREPGR